VSTSKKKNKGSQCPSPMKPVKLMPSTQDLERSWAGIVDAEGGERADKYIAEIARILSRSQLKARGARIFVNGREEKLSRRLSPGDRLEVAWTDEPSRNLEPEKLDVGILFEDANVFVFDKAQGMVTHPANGNWHGTLANAALWLDADRKGGGTAPRGGIVHRLDKDTSGVIIVARNTVTHEFLAAQFKNRTTQKEYWAIVSPAPALGAGHVENSLARDRNNRKKFTVSESEGKRAITDFRVLARWSVEGRSDYALVALYPKTGRTHQLRVHLAGIRCPILGDPLYGKKDSLFPEATLMLHARRLKIILPGCVEPNLFKAAMPTRFRTVVAALERAGLRG
jgi:23S rRNA pseudouridine1911/1915/1917 synthase